MSFQKSFCNFGKAIKTQTIILTRLFSYLLTIDVNWYFQHLGLYHVDGLYVNKSKNYIRNIAKQ